MTIGKASGPNGVSSRTLRELSNQLASPFCTFFNHLLHIGLVPAAYKEGYVCPVPKKGDLSVVSTSAHLPS